MARRDGDPDFVEAIARGLDVIRSFDAGRPVMTLSEVANVAGLARPTARRILRTLELLGYVRRTVDGAEGLDGYALTPRVLELGHPYIRSQGLWEIARPHLRDLVRRTHESSSIAQLDGSDIVYVARVAVPKIVALQVDIGTRFPAAQTSLGKVLLAALTPDELDLALSQPTRADVRARWQPDRAELDEVLRDVRARGWALTDEQLALGIRSVATPLRGGGGQVIAAMNVTVHAADTSVERLQGDYLPLLLEVAGELSADFARYQEVPSEVWSREKVIGQPSDQ